MGVHGVVRTYVPMPLLVVILRCYGGHAPMDDRTCAYAARHGHLELLQWAISNGCPYNRDQLCTMSNVKEWLAAGVLKL